MAELFGVKVPAISKHLTNIFETNELEENSVISILETTATRGSEVPAIDDRPPVGVRHSIRPRPPAHFWKPPRMGTGYEKNLLAMEKQKENGTKLQVF